jgi:hypothetical protein
MHDFPDPRIDAVVAEVVLAVCAFSTLPVITNYRIRQNTIIPVQSNNLPSNFPNPSLTETASTALAVKNTPR